MKTVYQIKSTLTLENGETFEQDDYVAVDGGMLSAAKRVEEHQLTQMYRGARDGEWSDVKKVKPHHAVEVCTLTIK